MSKQELTTFKKRYLDYFKKNNENSDICKWLENAVDSDSPDGYFFDNDNRLLVIFEHFEIDCSERPVKNGKPLGSIRHKNYVDKHKEVQKEIQASVSDYYESTKVIEQGYYKLEGDKKIYHLGQDGDKYRNNYINNFLESFETHHKKIKEYKNNVIEKLGIQPLKIKIIFLVEDKTIFGSYYLNNKQFSGNPVILTDTLQFQKIINNSNVDYIISGRFEDRTACIGYKGDDSSNKIDLTKKEFFVVPFAPTITVAKKTIIKLARK